MSNDQKHRKWDGSRLEVGWRKHTNRATIAIASSKEGATALLFDEGGYRAHYQVDNDKVGEFIDMATRVWRDHARSGSIAVVWSIGDAALGIGPQGPPPPPPGPPGDDILPVAALNAHHALLGFTELAFERGREQIK
jgi:hypothetical protein